MLSDEVRMQAYYDAIFKNTACFKDKVVLDVGTGTGILAIWSAQAGAAKVYAVEATDMAQKAQKLVTANNVGEKVVIIQGKIEDVEIPEKVDIIISEWMGLFLLRESMLDSVLFARDKWLKPGGALYPSHATMYLAATSREKEVRDKHHDYVNSMEDWEKKFLPKTLANFGVDMQCLTPDFDKEHSDYYLCSSVWCELRPSDLLTDSVVIKEIDCNTCTLEQIKSLDFDFSLKIINPNKSLPKKGPANRNNNNNNNRNNRNFQNQSKLTGFAGWFDVDFQGSPKNPAQSVVKLSTAPHIGYTHWGQQCFLLHPPVDPQDGEEIEGHVTIVRRKENQRLMNVEISHKIMRRNELVSTYGAMQTNMFHME